MASNWQETYEKLKKRKKALPKKPTSSTKKKDDEDDKWFKSGAFDDGYQIGDITKTILGTAGDVAVGAVKGIGNLAEGVLDLGTYAASGVADLFGNEEAAEKIKKRGQETLVNDWLEPLENKVDKNSLLGGRADNITQGLGYVGGILLTGGLGAGAGLGTAGTTALTTGLTGVSGMGSGMSEAYQGGATDKEAATFGAIAGLAEAGTELLFGGLGKAVNAKGLSVGLSSADDMLAKKISSKFSNQIAKNFAEYGVKAGAEGLEEVMSGFIQGVGKYYTYQTEQDGFNLKQIIEDENLLDQFIAGAVTSGIAQSGVVPGMKNGSLIEANKAGRDFVTGYTQNEQAVIDAEIAARTEGKQLTKKQKSKIEAEVIEDFEKGYISTDTIESTLGGDTYNSLKSLRDNKTNLETQIKELESKPNAEITVKEMEQLKALREELKTVDTNTLETKLQAEMGQKIQSDAYLQRSYQEKAKRSQEFTYETTEKDSQYRKGVMESTKGKLNDTTRSHETAEALVKLSEDRQMQYKFTNNAELRELGLVPKGKTANGLYVVDKDGSREILVNTDSKKYIEAVLVHETAHDFQTTSPETYTKLQDITREFAEAQNEYSRIYSEVAGMYKNVEGVDINEEVTSRLLEDYLGNKDFINSLTTKEPNIVQKIIDEIKYLVKKFTAGSPEARKLVELQHDLEKTYREAYKQTKATETTEGTKYSVSDANFSKSKVTDDKGNLLTLYHGTNGNFDTFENVKTEPGYWFTEDKEYASEHGKNLMEVNLNLTNPLDINTIEGEDILWDTAREVYGKQQVTEKEVLSNKVRDRLIELGYDGMIWEHSGKNTYIAFEPSQIRKINVKYSLDNQGRELSKGQIEYFKDSKVRDEKGNLLTVYHGTPNGGFNIYDTGMLGNTSGASDTSLGFHLTDNKELGELFSTIVNERIENQAKQEIYEKYGISENEILPPEMQKKIKNEIYERAEEIVNQSGEVKEHYIDIKKPLSYFADYGISEQQLADDLVYAATGSYDIEDTIDIYDDNMDFLTAIQQNFDNARQEFKYELSRPEAIQRIKEMGYDGLILPITDTDKTSIENKKGNEYIVFNSNQIKNVDNTNPTTDKDIRYSLSKPSFEQTQQAIALEKQNKTAEEIYLETGVYTGADGKLRAEIDDSKARIIFDKPFTPGETPYKLSDILKHDLLYKAYPEFKDIEVRFSGDLGNYNGAVIEDGSIVLDKSLYNPKEYTKKQLQKWLNDLDTDFAPLLWSQEEIDKMRANYTEKIKNYSAKNYQEALKSTLMHEIQHKIQSEEGFAKGTNVEETTGIHNRYIEKIRELNTQLSELYEKSGVNGDWVEKNMPRVQSGEITIEEFFEEQKQARLNSEYGEQIKSLQEKREDYKRRYGIYEQSGYELYRNTAGEIEAREVQKRLNYTPKQRRAEMPFTKDGNTVFAEPYLNRKFGVVQTSQDIAPIQYSLSEDSEGNELKPNVIKWAENSKARDSKGHLKVLYHGTATGEFTVFDKSKANPEGDWGAGFYLTDSDSDVETNYEGGGADFDNKVARLAEQIEQEKDIPYEDAEIEAQQQLYKGSYKITSYVKIENPAIVGETYIFDRDTYAKNYNIEDYDSEEDFDYDVDQLISDDIDTAIWAIEREYDFWNGTDEIRNVLWEEAYNGGIEIQHLKDRLNELSLETDEGFVANDVARIIIESLGYDGIIDPTVSTKWNMTMDSDTTHYIVFKPNQIKNITNENPTENDDIRYSLSEDTQYDYQSLRPKVRGGWTIEKIQKQLKQESSSRASSKEFAKYTDINELMDNIYYHGSISSHDNLKAGSTLPENARTGGYGEEYHSISLSKSRNIASNFASMGQSGTVTPVLLKKGANVIEMPNIEDSIELEDMLPQLWEQKVDAVKIGDWDIEKTGYGEQEIVILNPRAIATIGKGTTYFKNYGKPKFANLNQQEIIDLVKKYNQSSIDDLEYRIEQLKNREGIFARYEGRDAETEQQLQVYQRQLEEVYRRIEQEEKTLFNTDYSLSNESDIAPTSTRNQTAAQDIRLQVEEAIAPLQEEITQLKQELQNITDIDYSPAPQEVVEAQDREAFNTLDDADSPQQVEDFAPIGEQVTPTDSLFDTRDYEEVGSKKVNAYQYDNPEVRPYFQTAAREMLTDLQNSTRGERFIIGDNTQLGDNDYYYSGTKRATTEDIAELLDGMDGKYKYTYADIEKGLRAIIEDNGAENNAVSKRIEFYLDKRLREGYTDIDGYEIPADTEYLDMLRAKGITDYYNNIPLGEAPVSNVNKPVDNVSNNEIAPTKLKVSEAIRPAPDKDTHGHRLIRVKTDAELQTETNEEIAKILTEEPKVENNRNKRKWAILKANVLDKGIVFEDVALKHKNRELMGKWDYTLTSEARGQNVIGNGHYEYDPYSKTQRQVSKSLNDIRAEVDNTGLTSEFYEYIYHKHNVDRMRLEGRYEGMENKPVFGYNVTAEDSQQVVNKYESQHPEFITFAQDVYDYLDADRQVLVDNGVISQETADLWKSMYPHYVPIRRAGHTGNSINVPLDTGRTGVNTPIKKATGGNKDILPLFDTMASRTLQTYRATAKNSFGVELKNTIGTTINSQATNIDEVIDSVDAQEELLQEGKNGQKPTFTVFENGEKVTFEITEDMYDALKPLDSSSILSKTYGLPSNISGFHRGVLTQYNPVFMLTNAIKDSQDILINSQHAAKTYAKVPEATAQLISKGYWYQEYMNNGGEHNSYFDSVDNTFTTENKGLKKVLDLPPLKQIAQMNNFVERIPRLAEYIASREAGRSIEVSMLDAARVTTNFKAGGNLTKFLNRNGATFLNASVQGAMQQVRNIREANANGIRGWANLATKFAIAGLPAILLNSLIWDDDEEYEELSDYVKQNYYIVSKTEDGTFIRIPKGRTVAVIQEGVRQMQNLATGDDEADLKTFLDLFITNLAPNNPIDNNVLSPIVQVAKNETWYGEDLVPTRLQDLPAAEQYDESTDSFSRWLGEMTNFSPVKINYLLDQYTGGVGDVVLPMMTPEAKSDADTFGEQMLAPLKSKFTANATMNNQNVADFYDTSEKLTTEAKKSTATDEDVLRNKYINSVKAEMNELYAEKREIQNSDLSNSEKYNRVLEVQKQINELSKEALNEYKNVDIYSNYATAGDRQYRLTDEGEWQKINDKQLEKQDNVTSTLGISPNDYWSNKEEYDYAYENPSKYALANAISDYSTFRELSSELYDIKADKDENGKSISGSRKEKVFDYINNLDLDFEQKVMLAKLEYPSYDEYNYEIIEYLNNREDINYEQMVSILTELGFTVKKDGTITWD